MIQVRLNWSNVKELPQDSGTYVCVSPGGGVYVGSTSNLRKRFQGHKTRLTFAYQFACQGYLEFMPCEDYKKQEVELIKLWSESDDHHLINKAHNPKRKIKK